MDGQLNLFAAVDLQAPTGLVPNAGARVPDEMLPDKLWRYRKDAREAILGEVFLLDCCTGKRTTDEGYGGLEGIANLVRCPRCGHPVDAHAGRFAHELFQWGCPTDRYGKQTHEMGGVRPKCWDGGWLDPDLSRHDRLHWKACERCHHSFGVHVPQGLWWPLHPGQPCRRCAWNRDEDRFEQDALVCPGYVGGPYEGNPDRRVEVLRGKLAALGIELEDWS